MNKSIEKVIEKKLKKTHQQLMQAKEKVSSLYDLLDEARFIAKCRNCEKEKEYSKSLFEQRYISCKSDEACETVVDIAEKIKQAASKEKTIREEYGKVLLRILTEFDPVLINVRDHSEKQWDEVFDSEYDMLSEEKRVSLIALVEEDGGLYRMKDVSAF